MSGDGLDASGARTGQGGAVRALVLSAEQLASRSGNSSLLFTLSGAEVFAATRMGSAAPRMEHLMLELTRGLLAARTRLDAGWSRGWSSVVQPALSSAHLSFPSPTSLRVTLPAAHRYEARGPELVRLSLPPPLFSCLSVPEQSPPALLFVAAPRLGLVRLAPAAGPIAGGTVVRVTTRGVAPLPLHCVFGDGHHAPLVLAASDAFRPHEYLCTAPSAADAGGAAATSSVASVGRTTVAVRLVQLDRLEGIVLDSTGVVEAAAFASNAANQQQAQAQQQQTTTTTTAAPPSAPLTPAAARAVSLLEGVLIHSIW